MELREEMGPHASSLVQLGELGPDSAEHWCREVQILI